MATLTMTSQLQNSSLVVMSFNMHVQTSHHAARDDLCTSQQKVFGRLLSMSKFSTGSLTSLSKPIHAVRSGVEVSTDPKDNAITINNAKIQVESEADDMIQLRVDLTGNETQKVFDQVLTDLARSAPPIPGFRRQKGGKTSKVPKSFLLQVLGEDHVTKFVIREIVSLTLADYVKKENLNVKDRKINTVQTEEELKLSFSPGNEFGFNATLELETSETETTNSTSSEA